jgi:hypothetical protein
MPRYRETRDPSRGETLFMIAGVAAGLVAGAMVAQRMGGWRGISRRLRRGKGPLMRLVRDVASPDVIARLLGVGGVEALFGAALPGSRRRSRRRRPYDPYLDEYEVDDFERAAAGVDEELDDDLDGDDEEEQPLLGADEDELVSAEDIEHDLLEAFNGDRILRQRPIELSCDEDGVVELQGVVHSTREARRARRVASEVAGVTRVESLLEVREPQAS